MMERYDVVVIGAGPGGLAAATSAKQHGAERVLVFDRNCYCGGVLNQCIHDGFGLVRYKEALTGPEYAEKACREADKANVEIKTGAMVLSISKDRVMSVVCGNGFMKVQAGAIVLATGCRERTRGAISIPGTRPAGIYTAGVVQNLVNIKNIMIGKRVVVLGSGDIGLIMARRLTLEGAKVLAVIEILPEPCGLQRNISQCLYDFDIPLYVSHTVSRIIGKRKLEAIEISEVDDNKQPISGTERIIECDSLVLSVGLIPENEVALTAGIALNEKTNGIITDDYLQSSVPGIFACGNCRSVMDLADLVSEQGEVAGANATCYIKGEKMKIYMEKQSVFKKGFPEKGTVTCPLCPNGCSIGEYGEKVVGNKCKRGELYFRQEQIDPRRTLTTTVKGIDGMLHPIKIENVRKNELFYKIQNLNKN